MKAIVAHRCHCGVLVQAASFSEETTCPACSAKRHGNVNSSNLDGFNIQTTTLLAISTVNVELDPAEPDHAELEFQELV